jgi:hypothetical protein
MKLHIKASKEEMNAEQFKNCKHLASVYGDNIMFHEGSFSYEMVLNGTDKQIMELGGYFYKIIQGKKLYE